MSEIIAAFCNFYKTMTDRLEPVLEEALSALQGRPKKGIRPRQVVGLPHALVDGATLRYFLGDALFDEKLVAEAMYQLLCG